MPEKGLSSVDGGGGGGDDGSGRGGRGNDYLKEN
jgi:hypothetical protein